MSKFQVIVGSMLGGTEYVAEACEETLTEQNHQVEVHLTPDFSTIISSTFDEKTIEKPIWLICTSTHGAGELPDNIKAFVSDLEKCDQDLSTLSIFTIAIGDSSYDTFCKAGKDINNLLITKGCNELITLKTLDMSQDIDPEDLAQQWIKANSDQF